VTGPVMSERTPVELELSQIAWDHAQCYMDEEAHGGAKVEQTIANCKQQLSVRLSKIEEAHALRDYFERFYPTAGDALAGLRGSSCGPCVSDPGGFKNIAYSFPLQSRVPEDPGRSQTSQIFNWIAVWVAQTLQFGPGDKRLIIDIPVNTHDVKNHIKGTAVFTLMHMDDTFVQDVTTPGSLKGIPRGIYRYKIVLAGYKKFESAKTSPPGFLSFMRWKSNEKGISCTLIRENSELDSLPCNLE
jgi:hypothetical protein